MKFTLARTAALVLALAGMSAFLPTPKSNPTATANLKLPTGFTATVFAEDVGAARHLTVSHTGTVFVKLSKEKDGQGIIRLKDTNADGVADERSGFANYPGTGIALKNGYLYASSNSGIYRYVLNAREEVVNPDAPEEIVTGLLVKDRDKSKSIAVDDAGNVYVNIASWNDACREPGTGKGMMPCPLLDSAAGIWQFKVNRLRQSYPEGVRYATGLKNVVGLDWNRATNSLFVLMHGRGQFHDFYPQFYTPQHSADLPAETMYEVRKGDDAGWPYVYFDPVQKKKILAPEYGGDGKKEGDAKYLNPVATFPAHFGPNGLLFYTGNRFPARYRNGAFIAFHGQNATLKRGYFVAFVPFKNGKPSGNWEVFANGFAGIDLAKPTGPVQHRPCGLAQGPDGALYVTDDLNGSIYRIAYEGK